MQFLENDAQTPPQYRAHGQVPECKTEAAEDPCCSGPAQLKTRQGHQQHPACFKIHFCAQHQFNGVRLCPQ